MSIRGEKVGGVIREILSNALREIASELHAGLLTVTSVRMSDDLKHARVYLSSYGGKSSISEVLTALEDKKGILRSAVGKNMRIRYVPQLHFFQDNTLDEIQQIRELLDSAKPQDSDKSRPE